MNTYTYAHTYLPTYIHTYIHTYINTYVYMYVYIYIYIYRRRPAGEYRRPLSLRDLSRGTRPKKIKEKVSKKL